MAGITPDPDFDEAEGRAYVNIMIDLFKFHEDEEYDYFPPNAIKDPKERQRQAELYVRQGKQLREKVTTKQTNKY